MRRLVVSFPPNIMEAKGGQERVDPTTKTHTTEKSHDRHLCVLLGAELGRRVGHLDAQLLRLLDDGLALPHRHVVRDLGRVFPAVKGGGGGEGG